MGARLTLLGCYTAWRALILLTATLSPGPGYDTSTDLVLPGQPLLNKLVRWDAIYFTQIARRGYLFEQEWAFSWGFTRLLSFLTGRKPLLEVALVLDHAEAWVGIAISHAAHLCSVLVLFELTKTLFGSHQRGQQIAFLSACLHIISPAGIFLSAPYGESLFSCLQFSGLYVYALASSQESASAGVKGAFKRVLSGALLSLATLVRSNGLLSGLLFAYDAVEDALVSLWRQGNAQTLLRLASTMLAGTLIGLAIAWPQYLAYIEYCANASTTAEPRPWCSAFPPGIYAFVQSHYWNVGPFRYWTLSNLPLFALAAPMLALLALSSRWAWATRDVRPLVARIALPQAALAVLALTSYHVQIVTRLASGYPVWYWWLAHSIYQGDRRAGGVVRWMVMYGVVQAGLYASFLPPA